VNGARIFVRGLNRHDFDQHTGRVLSVESMRADLVLMKQFGFNAVRTSHYPNDPAFLDLTDELGMYVIDEADIESHAFQSTLSDDPRYLSAWVERLGDRSGGLPMVAPARGPRLTLVHRLEGQMGAVHDHGVWIVAGGIQGLETHRRYRVSDGRLAVAEERTLAPTDVATLLPPDDLHDHGHVAGVGEPAYILILAGDDQRRYRRNEWDPATGRHRVLEPGDPGRWLASEPMPTD